MDGKDKRAAAGNAAAMHAWLHRALGAARTETGTPVARVVHDLFLSEVRQQGWEAAERAWTALDAAALTSVGVEFERLALRETGVSYALPAGTPVMEALLGCALVGSETLGLDVDRPGLYDMSDLPARPDGSNLARLLGYIDELSRNLPCRAIGMPTLVERFGGRHPDHFLQFPPFGPVDGVVLRRDMNFTLWGDFFCAFTDAMVRELAAEVVRDMSRLWTHGARYAPWVRSARDAANRLASRLRGVGVHAVTLDVSDQPPPGDRVAVEFDAWDHSLRRGIVIQGVGRHEGSGATLDMAALDLADEVTALRAMGADGRIEILARAVLDAAPQSAAAAVLAELAVGFEAFLTLPVTTDSLRLRLHWRCGQIRVETRHCHPVGISGGSVTLGGRTLPESLVLSLSGRPVHLVFDSPFRCGAPIAAIENGSWGLVVTPEPDPWLVDCSTGRMWPDPRPAPVAATTGRQGSDGEGLSGR